jgi:hypothetical protein
VSTVFSGVLKMHFGELKKRFLPTAPIHLLWYIRNLANVAKNTFSACQNAFLVHYQIRWHIKPVNFY